MANIVYNTYYHPKLDAWTSTPYHPGEGWELCQNDSGNKLVTNVPAKLGNKDNIKNDLMVIPTDVNGVNMPPSEALIRAREAVIAGGYVTGLDAELQVRAGQHDDWLVTQIAYQALITQGVDVDVLRKYHAAGQMALAKAEQRPVVVRPRRSGWDVLCVCIARWFDKRSHKNNIIEAQAAKLKRLENQLYVADNRDTRGYEMEQLKDRMKATQREYQVRMERQRDELNTRMLKQQKALKQYR